MSRNELAEWMARERSTKATAEDGVEAFLPETLDRPKDCRRCFSADACMLYRKVGERTGRLPNSRRLTRYLRRKTTRSRSSSRRRQAT